MKIAKKRSGTLKALSLLTALVFSLPSPAVFAARITGQIAEIQPLGQNQILLTVTGEAGRKSVLINQDTLIKNSVPAKFVQIGDTLIQSKDSAEQSPVRETEATPEPAAKDKKEAGGPSTAHKPNAAPPMSPPMPPKAPPKPPQMPPQAPKKPEMPTPPEAVAPPPPPPAMPGAPAPAEPAADAAEGQEAPMPPGEPTQDPGKAKKEQQFPEEEPDRMSLTPPEGPISPADTGAAAPEPMPGEMPAPSPLNLRKVVSKEQVSGEIMLETTTPDGENVTEYLEPETSLLRLGAPSNLQLQMNVEIEADSSTEETPVARTVFVLSPAM